MQAIEAEVKKEVEEVAKEVKAYCLKCKKPVLVSNAKQTETKNKRQRVSGECPDCNKKVSQFLKSEKPEAVAAPDVVTPK